MYGKIEVIDLSQAQADGKTLQAKGQNLEDYKGRLESIKNQIATEWANDTTDAQSFVTNLTKSAEQIGLLSQGVIAAGRAFELNAIAQQEETKNKG